MRGERNAVCAVKRLGRILRSYSALHTSVALRSTQTGSEAILNWPLVSRIAGHPPSGGAQPERKSVTRSALTLRDILHKTKALRTCHGSTLCTVPYGLQRGMELTYLREFLYWLQSNFRKLAGEFSTGIDATL
jgi:hypothetical protein